MPDFEKMADGFKSLTWREATGEGTIVESMRYFYEHFECECGDFTAFVFGYPRCLTCGGLVGKLNVVAQVETGSTVKSVAVTQDE